MADPRDIPETRRPYSDPDLTFRADVANLVDDLRGSGMAAPPPPDLDDLSQPSIEDEAMQDRIDDGLDDGLMRTETDNDAGLRAIDEIVGSGATDALLDDRLDPSVGASDAAEGAERSPSEAGYDEAVSRDDLDDDLPESVDEALVDGRETGDQDDEA